MRKFIFLLLIFNVFNAEAQESRKLNSIKYSALHVFDATLLMSYEREFPENSSSLSLGAGVVSRSIPSGIGMKGFLVEPQFKKYFYKENISLSEGEDIEITGGYFSFFVQYRNQKNEAYEYISTNWGMDGYYKLQHENISSFFAGTLLGVNFQFLDAFTLDIYAGGGIKKSAITPEAKEIFNKDILYHGYNGVIPRAGLSFGILF
jgi:hypothetical protein